MNEWRAARWRSTGKRLAARLTVENADDEIGLLAQAFNETLGRIELSSDQLRRFTSDASHELRTPLNAIQNVGEVALRTHGSAEHYRAVMGIMLEESGRLTRLVDSLLTIARRAGVVWVFPLPAGGRKRTVVVWNWSARGIGVVSFA